MYNIGLRCSIPKCTEIIIVIFQEFVSNIKWKEIRGHRLYLVVILLLLVAFFTKLVNVKYKILVKNTILFMHFNHSLYPLCSP